MASFFLYIVYIVVKSDSWTSPSCLTLSLAKHCHPSPIKIYTLLCLSVLKSAREIFMHLNFHKQFLFCLSTIVIGCDWCTRPRFMFSLLSQMVPLPVTRGRIQHTDPGHPHPASHHRMLLTMATDLRRWWRKSGSRGSPRPCSDPT